MPVEYLLETMIASQAVVFDLTLITNDIDEFRRIPGLRAEDWT